MRDNLAYAGELDFITYAGEPRIFIDFIDVAFPFALPFFAFPFIFDFLNFDFFKVGRRKRKAASEGSGASSAKVPSGALQKRPQRKQADCQRQVVAERCAHGSFMALKGKFPVLLVALPVIVSVGHSSKL